MSATWPRRCRCCGRRRDGEPPEIDDAHHPHLATRSSGCARASQARCAATCSPRCSTISTRRAASRLLKLATGALRVGINARLAKQALADAFGLDVEAVEEVWHGLEPPFTELFDWAEGRGEPADRARRAGVPPVHARPSARRDQGLARRLCRRVEMGRHPRPARPCRRRDPALQPHRRRHLAAASPTSPRPSATRGVLDGELLVRGRSQGVATCMAARRRASTRCSSGSAARTSARRCSAPIRPSSGSTTSCSTARRTCASCPGASGARGSKRFAAELDPSASTCRS